MNNQNKQRKYRNTKPFHKIKRNSVGYPAGNLPNIVLAKDNEDSNGEGISNTTSCPYAGWELYFSDEVYRESSDAVDKIKTVESFIQRHPTLFNLAVIEENRSFQFDLKLLSKDVEFKKSWSEFESDICNHPIQSINIIGLAMHKIISLNLKGKEDISDKELKLEMPSLPIIRPRIINCNTVIQLKNLKASYYGKLVSMKGTVIRVGNIKLICTILAFECRQCSFLQTKKLCEGIFSTPQRCKRKGCRSQSFTPLLSSPLTQTLNWQCIRLQEIVADEYRDGGRVPRTIECELTADLVDSCSPGDIVLLNGIVKTHTEEEGSKHKNANVFQMYLDVVSVVNSKTLTGSGKATVEFHLKDYYAIKEIHSEKQLFRLIVQSLCPSIYGHEVVKAGLILCMFGGCQRYQDGRAEPHILIVGDPGLGKSRLLQSCANVAPRGVYVCGNTSTSSGLTVLLNRESGGDYALEAGALVLSDQGCCCIDEFDKMTTQHQALLEAMEQQTVSIAKAGVVCSLPARTSIIAAANPAGGHYNKAKTVSENLKMGPALLSRFDLVFILLDLPNEEVDTMLSEHVMALHTDLKKKDEFFTRSPFIRSQNINNEYSIISRLKAQRFEKLDLIPHQLLRKYIAYARKYVRPKLSSEAARVLQKFYLDLRKLHQKTDCTPVTTRQLESLIRLTEARAKVELREEATDNDAEEVVEILKYSMWDTFTDEFGTTDFKRSQHGSGMSSANEAKKFLRILQNRAELQSRSIFSVKELKDIAMSASIHVSDFYNFLSTLNIQGFLLKKGDQLYQVLSAVN